jgi:tRNA-(ms[2]io[6]A)-hydroxylase
VIRSGTDPRWVEVALADLDRVLVDHAHCEKKAAAQALSLVAAYPDLERLVRRLSALAIEELRHFRAVHRELRRRKLDLGRDPGDPYAKHLQCLVRSSGPGRLTDRLLVSGLIEARSHERLLLLADALPDAALSDFYRALARAEEGHARLFVDLARQYDDDAGVVARLEELAAEEARIVASLPLQPRIH